MTGEELYREWLGDPEGKRDAARYYPMMNPAQQQHWEDLAVKVGLQRETLQAIHNGLETWEPTPAVTSMVDTLSKVLAL